MMSFIAKLVIKPEARAEFEKAQTELRQLTLAREPDAYVYEFLKSRDDENTYMVVATFKDQAAFDHHMKIDFHDRLVPPIVAALAGELELKFYDGLGGAPESN